MTSRFYGLPSLTALAVFEAAARHQSLKDAASELNVTAGAVSHQIKALEQEISVDLFRRVHRGVELTREGEELYAVLARSFNQTAIVLERLRAGERVAVVTIGATTAVAAMWLLPRITSFWSEHPRVRINHRISDAPFDLKRADVELAVRYGRGNWPGEESDKLFDDEIIAVCSPDFAARHQGIDAIAMPDLSLVQMETVNRNWTTWAEWFRFHKLESGRLIGPRFDNYSIAMQAAADGVGVALCWKHLTGEYLASGKLVQFTDLSMPAPGSFYLTWNSHETLSDSAIQIRDWLLKTADKPDR